MSQQTTWRQFSDLQFCLCYSPILFSWIFQGEKEGSPDILLVQDVGYRNLSGDPVLTGFLVRADWQNQYNDQLDFSGSGLFRLSDYLFS